MSEANEEIRIGRSETGQVIASAAEVYEEFFLPTLFSKWPPRVIDAARIRRGERVLDVACGTGVLARAVARRVGAVGTVVGLDVNDGMLAVARQEAPHVEWRRGRAEALPFDVASFDAVVSQFGLMFFDDRRTAIEEMWRVLRPGGRLALAVWDSLENTPGYAAVTELLDELFGADYAAALRLPYVLGDREVLRALLAEAGVGEAQITTHEGTARFPSIDAWIYTDVKGWTLADRIDDSQYARLRTEAHRKLRSFVGDDGAVSFRAPAHIVTAVKLS